MHRGGGGGGRGRGRGRGSSRYRSSSRGKSRGSPLNGGSSSKTIVISGFSQRPQLGELGKLISSKSNRRIRWSACQVLPDKTVELKFDHDSDVRAISNLKNLQFKGDRLSISVKSTSRLSPEQQNVVLQYIANKYDVGSKFLDLGHAASSISGVQVDFNDRGFVDCICAIISENCRDVRTIRFDHNHISSLSSFEGLPEAAPELQNLSLANNKIFSFEEFSNLNGYSRRLQELMLNNNRLPDLPVDIYQHMVRSHFKSLKMLDQIPVRPLCSFAVPELNVTVPETVQKSFDPPETEQLAQTIVVPYFEMFDRNRDSLLALYLDNSHFSVAIHDSSLSDYLPLSRNLQRLQGWGARANLLMRGKIDIIAAIRKLPATQHLPHTFAVDVTALGVSQMLICVAGQFVEGNNNTLREFNRSFLLAQAPGGGFLILNDHLHVSDSSESVAEAQRGVSHTAPPALTSEQTMVVMQLAQQAGVTPEIAFQAYVSQNGDPNQALMVLRQHHNPSAAAGRPAPLF